MFGSCESDIRLTTPTSLLSSSSGVVGGTSSQFLMSPVYPKYYAGGKKCRWSLRAEPGQRIQLRFLDISLREGLSSRDPECSDSVRVSERGKTLLHMCGESTDDIVLLSQRSKLEVRKQTSTFNVIRVGMIAQEVEWWPLVLMTWVRISQAPSYFLCLSSN